MFVSWKKKCHSHVAEVTVFQWQKKYNQRCLLISFGKKKNCIMTLGHIFTTRRQQNTFSVTERKEEKKNPPALHVWILAIRLKCVKVHHGLFSPDLGPFCTSLLFNTADSDQQLHDLNCVRWERRPERAWKPDLTWLVLFTLILISAFWFKISMRGCCKLKTRQFKSYKIKKKCKKKKYSQEANHVRSAINQT